MQRDELAQLTHKFLTGEASEEEIRRLNEWYHSFQDQEVEVPRTLDESKEGLRKRLLKGIQLRTKVQERQFPRFDRRNLSWKIAASIALLVSAGIFALLYFNPTSEYITKTTQRGQRSTVTLSDGSIVKLNAGSAITFAEHFTGHTREVMLEGEAFFEVKKDPGRPFVVKSGDLQPTVLGTSFNIRAYPGDSEMTVTVASGRVQVESVVGREEGQTSGQLQNDVEQKKVVLSPNQQALYRVSARHLQSREISLEHYLAWTSDLIILDETPMEEVVKHLERWYDIEIAFEDKGLGKCRLTGKYKTDQLINILESLEFMQGITYRKTGERTFTLIGKPCQE